MRREKIRGALSFLAVTWFLAGLVAVVEVASGAEHGNGIHPEGVYLVKDGDSLWIIAGRYLNNPRLWRNIWKENPFIANPDLIFPGDPLVIPGLTPPRSPVAELPPLAEERVEAPEAPEPEVVPPGLEEEIVSAEALEGLEEEFASPVAPEPEVAPVEVAAVAESEEPELIVRQAAGPQPVIPRPALECSGFVAEPGEVRAVGVIIRPVDVGQGERLWYSDQIFVDLGGRKVKKGDRFRIARPIRAIIHPVTGDRVGVKVKTLGTVEIVSTVGEVPRARISYSCEDITAGDYLVAAKSLPDPPSGLSRPTSLRVKGYIVASKGDADSLGMGDIVYLDIGREMKIVPGDEFGVYQSSGIGVHPISGGTVPLAPVKRGELVVIRTFARSAAALLTRADRFLHVGRERIVLIRKMP